LADAVAAPDGAGHTRAAVERGMANLIERGWIVRLNPDAPRRERGRYRLGMPATVLMAGPGRDTPPGYTGLVGAPNAARAGKTLTFGQSINSYTPGVSGDRGGVGLEPREGPAEFPSPGASGSRVRDGAHPRLRPASPKGPERTWLGRLAFPEVPPRHRAGVASK